MSCGNDSWSETALIAITPEGGSDVEYMSITETIDIDIGAKEFDTINVLSGGQLVKCNPMEATTITIEAYPLEAGTDTGSVGKGFFDLFNTVDATQPIVVPMDNTRTKYRIAILWTNKSASSATEIIDGSKDALRFVAANAYCTKVTPTFTDKIAKFTVTFKVVPIDKDGDANIKMESTDGTADLPATAAYTSSVKW